MPEHSSLASQNSPAPHGAAQGAALRCKPFPEFLMDILQSEEVN